MSIFRRKGKDTPDISYHLRNKDIWHAQRWERFAAGAIKALAYDAVLDIYACSFNDEEIHVYGHPSVHFAFKIPEDKRDVVEQVQIVPVPRRLICLVKGCMVVWSLDGIWMDKPLSIVDIPNTTRFVGTSRYHSHALIPHPDGTIRTFDLLHLQHSPTTIIPSPDASEGVITDLLQNSRDLDALIVATFGCIYLWKFSLHRSLHNFTLPDDEAPRATCLASHPREDIVVAGMLDGRLAFWGLNESIPFWVTTASEISGEEAKSDPKSDLEPVFKLLWTASEGGSNLTILGGKPAGQPRLITLHFDATPFASREQLIAQNVTQYDRDVQKSADVKDIIFLAHSGVLLSLAENGHVTLLQHSNTPLDIQAKKDQSLTLETSGLSRPLELYPPVLSGQVALCSSERTRFFESIFNKEFAQGLAGGGIARPPIQKYGPDPRLSKYERTRLLCLLHGDSVIRFYDATPRLLLASDPLILPYPGLISQLNLDLKSLLDEPLVWTALGEVSNIQVAQLLFLAEPLEVYVTLNNGNIIAWKYQDASNSRVVSAATDARLLDLSSLPSKPNAFAPRFLFSQKEGSLVTFVTSEIGFSAAAYDNGAIYILDMREPRILYQEEKKGQDADPVTYIRFSICNTSAKGSKRLILAIFYQSGRAVLLPIIRNGGSWVISEERVEVRAKRGLANTISCFLIDLWSGEDLSATAESLASLFAVPAVAEKRQKSVFAGDVYRITVSPDTIRCDVGWDGQETGHINLKGVRKAEVVRQEDSSALAACDAMGRIYVLSIPQLQVLAQLQASLPLPAIHSLQFVKETCDFTIQNGHCLELWTMSKGTRVVNPNVTVSPREAPLQGEETGIISWLLGKGHGMTGEQFDALVGGPDREQRSTTMQSNTDAGVDHGIAMQEAMAAMAERGERLGTFVDKTDELANAAEGMAAQAKRLAARQSKHRIFGF